MALLATPTGNGSSNDGIQNVFVNELTLNQIVAKTTDKPCEIDLYMQFIDENSGKKKNVFYKGKYVANKNGTFWAHDDVTEFMDALKVLGLDKNVLDKLPPTIQQKGVSQGLIDLLQKNLGNSAKAMVTSYINNKDDKSNSHWTIIFPVGTLYTDIKETFVHLYKQSLTKTYKSGKYKGQPKKKPWDCPGNFTTKIESNKPKSADPLAGSVTDAIFNDDSDISDLPFDTDDQEMDLLSV